MTMPTPDAFTATFSRSELETYQGYIQSVRDKNLTVANSMSSGPIKSTFLSACSDLTTLIGLLETKAGQTGIFTPSGGTGKGS